MLRSCLSGGDGDHLGRWSLDKLGVVIAALAVPGFSLAPFVTLKANRIVQGAPLIACDALPGWLWTLLACVVVLTLVIALLRVPLWWKFAAACFALTVLLVSVGLAANHLTPPGNSFARISPAFGFWILLFAFSILLIDCLAKMQLTPAGRLACLAVGLLVIAAILVSGVWGNLSLLKEFSARADSFWREAFRHIALAIGSLVVAFAIGLPVGLFCYRVERLRSAILSLLNVIQTIPSIALFGLLIAPLGWISLNVPGASELGIRGIGAAPTFIALVLYALLPIVANTVSGLTGVDRAVSDAASGLGMTARQKLWHIELPLATPAILAAVRIVLVQNIGMATIAALIGGGGFGVFVFQGIGQTASDLVLLGALPTVALALSAAVIMDAITEMTARAQTETAAA